MIEETLSLRLYADKNYGGRMYSFLIIDGPGWNNTYTKNVPNLGDYNLTATGEVGKPGLVVDALKELIQLSKL